LHELIQHDKLSIKKTQKLMENEEIDLWATDEVHFQQYGSRCRMWIPPEIGSSAESVGQFDGHSNDLWRGRATDGMGVRKELHPANYSEMMK
jgi:hypothetical protein